MPRVMWLLFNPGFLSEVTLVLLLRCVQAVVELFEALGDVVMELGAG